MNRWANSFLIIVGLGLACGSLSVLASDHIDGPVTSKHKITDLTDFYAFKTPEQHDYLTLIANVHPLATQKNHFDSKVIYRFTLRPATIDTSVSPSKIITSEAEGKKIICEFVTPRSHKGHTMTCSASPRLKRTVRFNAFDVRFDNSGLRLFAGHRADAFFFNADWAKAASTGGKINGPASDNTMAKINALSIVVEVDVQKLFGRDVSLIAMTVESLAKKDGKLYRYDRVGRPEVTNVTMVPRPGKDLRDQYNIEKAFNVSRKGQVAFINHIKNNIRYYDGLDRKNDWTPAAAQAYAEVIVDDFLLIDLSQPEKPQNEVEYFSIESDLLNGREHSSRGGRRPTDDIMDRLFTILINAEKGATVSDGINAPSPKTSHSFPYLAKPDFSWGAWLKASVAKWFI